MTILEPRALRHFVAIAEHKSFRKAADSLRLSQPALSNSIQQLESALAVKLFERGPYGILLTVFGEALYQRSKIILAEVNFAVDELNDLRGAQRGALRIGSGPSILGTLIPKTMMRLMHNHPGLTITVHEGLEEELLKQTREGAIELAVSSTSLSDVNLDFTPMFHMRIVPIVRSKHPILMEQRSSLKDLTKYPWILPHTSLEPERLEHILKGWAIEGPEIISRSNSPSFMKALVEQSNFVSFLPRPLISLEEQAERLVALNIGDAIYHKAMGVITRKHSLLSPAAETFVKYLKSVAKEIGLVDHNADE